MNTVPGNVPYDEATSEMLNASLPSNNKVLVVHQRQAHIGAKDNCVRKAENRLLVHALRQETVRPLAGLFVLRTPGHQRISSMTPSIARSALRLLANGS